MVTLEITQINVANHVRTRRIRAVALLSAIALFSALAFLSSCARHGLTDSEAQVYAKAKASYLQGDYAMAIAIVEGGRLNSRLLPQAALLQAKCEFFLLKPERSELILRKLVKRYPRYAEAELYLARSLLAEARFDEAQGAIEGAMRWNPDDPRLLALMGSLHESKREYQKAFEYYTRSCVFADELGKSEVSLAELYWRFGQADQALERVRLAKALVSPESALARPLGELEARIAQGGTK